MDGGRRVRGEGTWAAARAAYLDGAAAADVCERFDLGLSALRVRARREGWRRADQADPDPELDGEDDDGDGAESIGEAAPTAELAEQARRRAAAALGRGRLREAQGWTKLWRDLAAAAASDSKAASEARWAEGAAERRAAVDETLRDARAFMHACRPPRERERDRAAGPERQPSAADPVHSVHSVHPVSERAPADPPPRAPLNRADRRRREKLAAARAWKARQAGVAGAGSGPAAPAEPP